MCHEPHGDRRKPVCEPSRGVINRDLIDAHERPHLLDVRLEFYDDPDRREGYQGSATRAGFRSVCLSRIDELLANPTIIAGPLPGPRVSSVEHLIDTVHDPDGDKPSVTVVARVPRPGATEIKQLGSAGWRLDINQTP